MTNFLKYITIFVLLVTLILTFQAFHKYAYSQGRKSLEDEFIKAILYNESTVIGPFIIVKDFDRNNRIFIENPKWFSNRIEYYKQGGDY